MRPIFGYGEFVLKQRQAFNRKPSVNDLENLKYNFERNHCRFWFLWHLWPLSTVVCMILDEAGRGHLIMNGDFQSHWTNGAPSSAPRYESRQACSKWEEEKGDSQLQLSNPFSIWLIENLCLSTLKIGLFSFKWSRLRFHFALWSLALCLCMQSIFTNIFGKRNGRGDGVCEQGDVVHGESCSKKNDK